jgi:hypothetical protein
MVKVGENWNCPYCGHAQVLSEDRYAYHWHAQHVSNWKERIKFGAGAADQQAAPIVGVEAIICANDECRELTLTASLARRSLNDGAGIARRPIQSWRLCPSSSAKPQPDYIPQVIRDDYYEACSIRDLSPKASATLTRRCLQGMIRDFCKISKSRLIDEINELRKRVEEGKAPRGVELDNVEAIDNVRKVGNIGAHMEADVSVIVDVEPDEAQILIQLVELLFDEWYVAREKRTKGLAQIKNIAEEKKKQQKPS